jgi:ssDNA-binding Zn-finger/Zn-ribbon topoisomerase 1
MEFVFSEGEQAFYKEKGFENEPQRCPECRKAKKAQRRNNNGFSGGRGQVRDTYSGNRW